MGIRDRLYTTGVPLPFTIEFAKVVLEFEPGEGFQSSGKYTPNLISVFKFIKLCKSNILLKGNTTLIGSNKKIIKNTHSSSELAVIGSGDVLAGIIASLVGDNKMSIIEAAAAAAWLHGDIARKYGKGLISEDLIKGIQSGLERLAKK